MKLKDVTPLKFVCHGGFCPSIFETDKGTYLIVGTGVDSPETVLPGKIGSEETVVEVPADLLRSLSIKPQV